MALAGEDKRSQKADGPCEVSVVYISHKNDRESPWSSGLACTASCIPRPMYMLAQEYQLVIVTLILGRRAYCSCEEGPPSG